MLRFRLLRQRLERASGLRASLPLGCDAPIESDCLTPLSDASLATPAACLPAAIGGPALRRLRQEWQQGLPAAAAPGAPVNLPAAPAAEAAPSPMVEAQAAATPLDERSSADAEAMPAGQGGGRRVAAGGQPEAAAPPFASRLGDHLSSATPSDCPSLGSMAEGGTQAAGVAEADGMGHGGQRWRSISESSCTTLREVVGAIA